MYRTTWRLSGTSTVTWTPSCSPRPWGRRWRKPTRLEGELLLRRPRAAAGCRIGVESFRLDVGDAADPADAARAVVADLGAVCPRPDRGRAAADRLDPAGPGRHLLVLVFHPLPPTHAFAFSPCCPGGSPRSTARCAPAPRRRRAPRTRRAPRRRTPSTGTRSGSPTPSGSGAIDLAEDLPAARLPASVRHRRPHRGALATGTASPHRRGWPPAPRRSRPSNSPPGNTPPPRRRSRRPTSSPRPPPRSCGTCAGLSEQLLTITVNHRVGALRRSLGLLSNPVRLRSRVDPAADFAEPAEALGRERRRVLRHARHDISPIKRATGHACDARSPFGAVVNALPSVDSTWRAPQPTSPVAPSA